MTVAPAVAGIVLGVVVGHGDTIRDRTRPRPDRPRRGVLVNGRRGGQSGAVITERQQAMLEFERTFWTYDDPKETVIRARFQCSADEYYAELNELLELPEALDHDPLVVRRLQRQRLRRRRERLDTGTDAQGGAHA
jgi:hypothetical protein